MVGGGRDNGPVGDAVLEEEKNLLVDLRTAPLERVAQVGKDEGQAYGENGAKSVVRGC